MAIHSIGPGTRIMITIIWRYAFDEIDWANLCARFGDFALDPSFAVNEIIFWNRKLRSRRRQRIATNMAVSVVKWIESYQRLIVWI